jgi:hypothetical protein
MKALGVIALCIAAGMPCFTLAQVAPLERYLKERPVKRLALLLSNWSYPSGRLDSTDLDLAAMEKRLIHLGFEVSKTTNFRSAEELNTDALVLSWLK